MNEGNPGVGRGILIAACAALALAASGCKREEPRAAVSPPAPGPTVPGGAATTTGAAFTVEAADLASTPSPLRVVFGERGAGVAWVVQRADGMHVVHGGKVGRAVAAVDQVLLSPDGERIAYGAQLDGAWRMIVDGEAAVPSTAVEEPVFSPDGRHVAWFANDGETKRIVVDTKVGPECRESIGRPVFSADSTLLAFAAVPGQGQPARLAVSDLSFARVDARLDAVKQLVANEARTALAAVVAEGKGERLAVLGLSRQGAVTKGARYDSVSSPVFGPDGATVAYLAEKGGRRLLVLGAKEALLPEGSASGQIVIRPGGAGAGLIMALGTAQFLHEPFAGGGSEDAQRYDELSDLTYGADGRSKAFCARAGASWFVVVNGEEGPRFDRVVSPVFSPDGKLLAYRARKDGRRFVVISDPKGKTLRQLPAYEQVFPVRFAPDGKSIAYGVKDGPTVAWKVEPL